MKHALFLDTMIYLHYRPVEQIDWHGVLSVPATDDVLLVVPGITVREIDKHKNGTPRLRGRAQRVSEQLVTWLSASGTEIRPSVRVVGALRPPSLDMAALDLDPAWNDDVLVASALDYQRANEGVRVVLVTQDGYPRIKAGGLGLPVLSLAGDLKLPAEEDPTEKENRELKRQLQQLQALKPALDLQFVDGAGKTRHVEIRDPGTLTAAEIAAAVQQMEERYPPVDALRARASTRSSTVQHGGDPDGLGALLRDVARAREIERMMHGPTSDAEYTRYAKERAAYLTEYADYLPRLRKHECARARSFALEVELINTGSVPALDIDVHLHIPDGVLVSDEEQERRAPKAPAPPQRPRNSTDLLRDAVTSSFGPTPYIPQLPSFEGLRAATPRNVSSLDIQETESYDIRCHVQRVKHGRAEKLPAVYISVPKGAPVRPFQVTYTLHAANLPQPVNGTVNVVLTSA